MSAFKIGLQHIFRKFGYGVVRSDTLDALNAINLASKGSLGAPLAPHSGTEDPADNRIEPSIAWRHVIPPLQHPTGPVTTRMASYESVASAAHRAGSLQLQVVDAIEHAMPNNCRLTVETGCGKSTILFSNLSEKHLAFTLDDRKEENSSVQYFLDSDLAHPDRVEFVYGPTQLTLLDYDFRSEIDAALIDGPHGFPFPQLEYWRLYPHIRTGGILVIDDVHIRHIGDMFRFLASEDMWTYVGIFGGSTGILRRTSAPTIFPTGDQWWDQAYNTGAFPSMLLHDRPSLTIGARIDFNLGGNSHLFELFGWAKCEPWGRWAVGDESMLVFLWHGPTQGDLELTLHARASSDLTISLNGVQLGTIARRTDSTCVEHRFRIPAQTLRTDDGNQLLFRPTPSIKDSHQPPRSIGIAMERIQFLNS